jgi:hypothetical protein
MRNAQGAGRSGAAGRGGAVAEELAAERFARALRGVARYDEDRADALPWLYGSLRQELLFDPETAEILNERQVVAHPVQGLRAAVGTAIEDIVYTKRAVTDATERP